MVWVVSVEKARKCLQLMDFVIREKHNNFVCGANRSLSTDHPNMCWDDNQKAAYDIGEQWQSKGCVVYECVKNKAGLHIAGIT